MTMGNMSMPERPVAIAPAPTSKDSRLPIAPESMQYACQTCTRRKVKCDKLSPVCSTCAKSKLECSYQAPPPRKRKRRLSVGPNEKLARYERMLQQHGLLAVTESPENGGTDAEQAQTAAAQPTQWNEASRVGRLVSGDGTTRYIDSNLWRNLGEEEMTRFADEAENDEEEEVTGNVSEEHLLRCDPFSAAFLGTTRSLRHCHPSAADAMTLWRIHTQNVEPICKVLHVPTVSSMIEATSAHPHFASRSDECLLFAIYHFAIVSMDDEDCQKMFNQSRASLRARYHNALKQALVNAAFLKTTQTPVLQAFLLYLLSSRHQNDPHTLWMLTGSAVRIAQRMGLHRDGEALGLPPFEVEVRRRIFYQLIPLDGYASQISGTGITVDPGSWDSKQPLNINDDQIWPGMTQKPEEQKGATEMIFFLARAEMGAWYMKSFDGKKLPPLYKSFSWHGCDKNCPEMVDEMEGIIETKYLRYCDILNPIHTLLLGMVRSAANAARLRMKLPVLRNETATDEDRREACTLASRIIDTDSASHANPSLKRFMWHIKAFFQWDALICMLISMTKRGLLAPTELEDAWRRIETVYHNHAEIFERNRMLVAAVARITLKAWNANPPAFAMAGEPFFIEDLRKVYAKCEGKRRRPAGKSTTAAEGTESATPAEPSPRGVSSSLEQNAYGMDLGLENDFTFDSSDWMFWDKLITDFRNAPDDHFGDFSQ